MSKKISGLWYIFRWLWSSIYPFLMLIHQIGIIQKYTCSFKCVKLHWIRKFFSRQTIKTADQTARWSIKSFFQSNHHKVLKKYPVNLFTVYFAVAYLEPWKISPIELFYKNSLQVNTITYFYKKFLLREKCPYSELFWSAFSRIRTKYEKILRISP